MDRDFYAAETLLSNKLNFTFEFHFPTVPNNFQFCKKTNVSAWAKILETTIGEKK